MIKKFTTYNESVKDLMTPKSPEQYLSPSLFDILTKSRELGWEVYVKENQHSFGSPVYIEIKFKNFRLFIEDNTKGNTTPMSVEFFITRSRDQQIHRLHSILIDQYDIPNLSGGLNDWDELKKKIDTLLDIPILNESVRDMMKPKTKKEIKDNVLSKRITYNMVSDILKDKASKRMFTTEELTTMLHSPNITNLQRLYLLNGHLLCDIRKHFNDKHIKRILSLINEPMNWAHTTFTNKLGDIYTQEEIREKLSGLSPRELSETITRYGLQKYY